MAKLERKLICLEFVDRRARAAYKQSRCLSNPFMLWSETTCFSSSKSSPSCSEQVEEYVEKPSAGSVLVLRVSSLPSNQRIYKYIVANGQVHDCEAPKKLGEWIINRAKGTHKLAIKPDAAALLLDLIGPDLGRLDNELAKLGYRP